MGDRPEDEITVLFFRYIHCPDVCPTTMADLSLARDMLEPELQDHMEVAFVTEDLSRDTAAAPREWLDRFDPGFTGLIGPAARHPISTPKTSNQRSAGR